MLDQAEANDGFKFNGAVIRRGLKSMINSAFSLESWDTIAGEGYESVQSRFVPEEDDFTADTFFMMLCSQVFQKLLRTAQAKFKIKDRQYTM